jgi:Holliday junction resolvase RusA-like endonuclease
MLKLLSHEKASGRSLSFFVPGHPRGKARPIYYGKQIVKDKKTAAYENLVKLAAERALVGQNMFEGAVAVHMTVRFQPPASTKTSKLQKMISGGLHYIKRPDIDNLTKAIMDGCQGVLFSNDAVVAELVATKIYAAVPGVEVTLIELLDD